MKEYFTYLLSSGVCLAIFLSIYYLFLRRLTFFRFNRFFLVAGLLLATVLPAVELSYEVEVAVPAVNYMVYEPTGGTATAGTTEITEIAEKNAAPPWSLIFAAYFTGIFLLMLRNASGALRFYKIFRSARKTRCEKYIMLDSPLITTPFSLFRYIGLDSMKLSRAESDIIIRHELSHIVQRHWLDLACSECALLLQWFNPFAWLYVTLLKENHEFLADRAVMDEGTSAAIYRATLINQQFGGPVFSLSNKFRSLKNPNRLNMITKRKSSPWKRCAALAVLPLLGTYLWADAEPVFVYTAQAAIPATSHESATQEKKAEIIADTPAKKTQTPTIELFDNDSIQLKEILGQHNAAIFAMAGKILEQEQNPEALKAFDNIDMDSLVKMQVLLFVDHPRLAEIMESMKKSMEHLRDSTFIERVQIVFNTIKYDSVSQARIMEVAEKFRQEMTEMVSGYNIDSLMAYSNQFSDVVRPYITMGMNDPNSLKKQMIPLERLDNVSIINAQDPNKTVVLTDRETFVTFDNTPLVVVDGNIVDVDKSIERSKAKFNDLAVLLGIPAEKFESITTIEDGAAVRLWGERGVNGVIDIRTKGADTPSGTVSENSRSYHTILPAENAPEELKLWVEKTFREKYPELTAVASGGKITYSVIAGKSGKLVSVSILSSSPASSELMKAALEVLTRSPKWREPTNNFTHYKGDIEL